MTNAAAPSLLSRQPTSNLNVETPFTPHSLLDLMYDGFYALFMLKNRSAPIDDASFANNVTRFLDDFDRGAKKMNAAAEDIYAAKYAYCAAVDEIILRSQFAIRDAWERRPLQLLIFGDQLAGTAFFDKIEELRAKGSAHMQALEVFHMCLLLGFEGKYMIEGSEKLNYFTSRLGDEIAHMKGKAAVFAPHWARPDQIMNKLRNEVPLWVIFSVFALIIMLGYTGMNWMLSSSTEQNIHAYNDIVKLAPRAANITITLP
jgi:type VI secretion system protein ImpK